MPKLTIQSGPGSGTDFSFTQRAIIGRAKNADLCLDDPSVSRRHAELTVRDGDWYVTDLGSANKTYVNGRPLSAPARLLDGDVIAVGAVVVRFRASDATLAGARGDAVLVVNPKGGTEHILLRMPAQDPGLPQGVPQQDTRARGTERRLRFLNDLSRMTSEFLDENVIQAFVLSELLQLLPQASRAFMLRVKPGVSGVEPAFALTPSGPAEEITISDTIVNEVLRCREAVLIVDSQSDGKYDSAESIMMLQIRSAIAAPLVFRGEVLGILQVDSVDAARPFGQADVALMVSVASNLAVAIAYARLHASVLQHELLQHDLLLARRIQQHFLPGRPPALAGYRIAVEWRAALAIGGDLYDFLPLGPDLLGIAVGDVSGKGVSAALYAAKIGSELRFQAAGLTDPAEILWRLNRTMASSVPEGMFVTLAMIVLNPKSGRVVLASAGHPLPLRRTAGGDVQEVGGAAGPPIGILEDSRYQSLGCEVRPGEVVALYSDGVSEGLNPKGQVFGKDRIVAAVRRSNGTAGDVHRLVLADLEQFVGAAPQSDDITLICVGRS